jgi:CBS domain containing-hemolysin-like protein
VHAQQYYEDYFSVVPTIGTLFLLGFVGAAGFGAILFSPVRRLGRGLGDPVLVLAALGGIGIAVATFVSLLVSEYTPLLGFMESGYRLAVVLTLVFDVATTLLLGAFVALVGPKAVVDVLARRKTR